MQGVRLNFSLNFCLLACKFLVKTYQNLSILKNLNYFRKRVNL